MAKILAVASGKGGVGKTTTVSNLGALFTEMEKKSIIVDGNLTTPNLSLHLGIPFYPTTLHDVLKGRAYITEAMYIHPSGIRIIPASLNINDLKGARKKDLKASLNELLGDNEIIIMDCAAGLGEETRTSLEAADDLLLVVEPSLPSVTDALKTRNLAKEIGVETIGVIVNKINKNKNQLTKAEVENMLDSPILGSIPEDTSVPESIAMKLPVVHHKPNSKASIAFRKVAEELTGERMDYTPSTFFQRVLEWLRS